MSKSAKIIIYVLIALATLMVVALIAGTHYMFAYALDSQFSSGSDITRITEDSGEEEKWLAENSSRENLTSYDGLNLVAFNIPAAKATDNYVLLIHGYKAGPFAMADYAYHYHQQGWNVLLPHHRAHGESEGRYIGMGWQEHLDMLGWLDLILQQNPEAQIILHGVSMGAATTMITTGSPNLPSNVKAAIADCGYTTVTEEFTHQVKELFGLPPFPLLPLTSILTKFKAGYTFDQVDCVSAVKNSTTPTLFIHGDADNFVPFWMLDVVYQAAACPKEKLVVPGAVHAKSHATNPELYWSTVESFLQKNTE